MAPRSLDGHQACQDAVQVDRDDLLVDEERLGSAYALGFEQLFGKLEELLFLPAQVVEVAEGLAAVEVAIEQSGEEVARLLGLGVTTADKPQDKGGGYRQAGGLALADELVGSTDGDDAISAPLGDQGRDLSKRAGLRDAAEEVDAPGHEIGEESEAREAAVEEHEVLGAEIGAEMTGEVSLAGLVGAPDEIHGTPGEDIVERAHKGLREVGTDGDPKEVGQFLAGRQRYFRAIDGADAQPMPAAGFDSAVTRSEDLLDASLEQLEEDLQGDLLASPAKRAGVRGLAERSIRITRSERAEEAAKHFLVTDTLARPDQVDRQRERDG